MLYCVLSLSDSPALALTMPRSLSETWKSLLAVNWVVAPSSCHTRLLGTPRGAWTP